jgi:integrase
MGRQSILKNVDKEEISIEIISYKIAGFKYRQPIIVIDNTDKVTVEYKENNSINIPKITFLYRVISNSDTQEQIIIGLDVVNVYLMHLSVNGNLKDTSTYSRAFIHYFSFLAAINQEWNDMSFIQSQRPTYMFKNHLEAMYRSTDPESNLAGSTVKSYMRSIVNFYRFYVSKKYPFINPPFENKVVKLNLPSPSSSMNSNTTIEVQSSDLRPNVPAQKAGVILHKLRSVNKHEWDLLDKILRVDRKILKNSNGYLYSGSLPLEFSYIFLIMRYTGLRRAEVLTLNSSLIFKPNIEQLKRGYVSITVGPKFGVDTKNDKEREIEFPTGLMDKVYEYLLSERFIKRRNKFLNLNQSGDQKRIPIFLNNRGTIYSKGSANARWSEIRQTIVKKLNYEFTHKMHNLRATYGVFRLFSLLDAGMKQSDALVFVQTKMGHEKLATTLEYLKQTEGAKSADELSEIALNHLFDIHDKAIK